ncbi:SUMO1 sentrin specific peptidase 8 [Phlyctochytrium bullatum]|nr:SUMO1 sentrin specific peptidase 8 [Phlyctochytrium bullatum]
MTDDLVVLNYGDCVLRKSDYILLDDGQWLNDTIIEFFYEWLEKHHIRVAQGAAAATAAAALGFMRPAIVHLLAHAADASYLGSVVEGLNLTSKTAIFIPVNDNETEMAGEIDTPSQINGYDCGVYVITITEVISYRLVERHATDVAGKPGDLSAWRLTHTITPQIVREKRHQLQQLITMLSR